MKVIVGGCGRELCLGVWRWWRTVLIWRMVWGVKVMLMREGIVWVGLGCDWLGDWEAGGVGRSGEVAGAE